jgi:hypothetical protein
MEWRTGICGERLPGFPTELPLALLRPIVLCASGPSDLVLDPFSGSGTTGAAALESGRRFVGIERTAMFVYLSRRRLAGLSAQEPRGGDGGPDPSGASPTARADRAAPFPPKCATFCDILRHLVGCSARRTDAAVAARGKPVGSSSGTAGTGEPMGWTGSSVRQGQPAVAAGSTRRFGLPPGDRLTAAEVASHGGGRGKRRTGYNRGGSRMPGQSGARACNRLQHSATGRARERRWLRARTT